MPWRKSPQSLIDLFDTALPADPRVERRKMFGYPAAFLNGHLFVGLHQENLILKLPAEDRQMLVAQCGARSFEPMPGRAMREYLVAPDSLLDERDKLRAWIERAIEYVGALPPKAAKAKKPKAAAESPAPVVNSGNDSAG